MSRFGKVHDKKILLNSFIGISYRIVIFVLGIVSRRVFLMYMGQSLSGLSGLYSNLLDFLSLASAGLSASVLHKLYLLRAQSKEEEINKLISFSHDMFRLVSCVIFVAGLLFSLFLDKFIYNNEYNISFLKIVFLLQVVSQCIPYFVYSRKLVLQAYEDIYIISMVELIVNVVSYVAQILVVIYTKNYYMYLMILVLKFLMISILINTITKRKYSFIKKVKYKLEDMKSVMCDLKDTFAMQFSNFIYLSTDSVVLSFFLGLVSVNLYTNYLIVINAVITLFDEVNAAIRASVGNKIAKNQDILEVRKILYTNYNLQFVLVSAASIMIANLIAPFVVIWLGTEYLLATSTVVLLCISFFSAQINAPISNIMTVCGKFSLDKKIVFLSAIINIILSVAMVQMIGMNGVIVGTICSNTITLVLRGIFYIHKQLGVNVVVLFGYIIIMLLVFVTELCGSIWICNGIRIDNYYLKGIMNFVVCSIIIFGVAMVYYLSKSKRNIDK